MYEIDPELFKIDCKELGIFKILDQYFHSPVFKNALLNDFYRIVEEKMENEAIDADLQPYYLIWEEDSLIKSHLRKLARMLVPKKDLEVCDILVTWVEMGYQNEKFGTEYLDICILCTFVVINSSISKKVLESKDNMTLQQKANAFMIIINQFINDCFKYQETHFNGDTIGVRPYDIFKAKYEVLLSEDFVEKVKKKLGRGN